MTVSHDVSHMMTVTGVIIVIFFIVIIIINIICRCVAVVFCRRSQKGRPTTLFRRHRESVAVTNAADSEQVEPE